MIVEHQLLLFKNKLTTLNRIYASERSDERERKILNDWIYIASSYCYILYENDLDCCDELAVEIFTAYYIIAKLVFMEIKKSTEAFSSMNNKDRANMNILLTKYTDLLTTSRHSYFQTVAKQVDKLPPLDDTELHQRSKSLDINSIRENKKNCPAEFYPQTDGDDDSSASSTYDSSDSSLNDFSHTPIQSIGAETLLSMDPKKVIILNIQSRNIHSTTRSILTLDPNLIVEPKYFESSVLPYLQHENTIVFFTRSTTLTEIENSVHSQLLRHNFTKVFWLQGGYYAFKSEFLKKQSTPKLPQFNNDLEPRQSRPLSIASSPSPPPIPISKPLITRSTEPDQKSTSPSFYQTSPAYGNQFSPSQLQVANTNTNQRYSHSYSSLTDSNFEYSDDTKTAHPIYASKELNPKKSTYPNGNPSNRSLQNLSAEKLYSNLQSQDHQQYHHQQQQQHSESQPASQAPLSLPPIPPVPVARAIQPVLSVPSIPPASSPHKLYQLSRLDYKPLVSLRNLGSTCYINSMIQCLFSLKKFRQFFINDDTLKAYIRDLNNRNLKLTSGFHEMFNTFYDKSPHNALPPVVDITRFLSIIARLNPSYNIPNEQQEDRKSVV